MFGQHLLCIEDDPDIAQLVCQLAREVGFYPSMATQAQQIAPIYQQVRPHVIVLDVLMPEMDGFDVIQFLHREASDTHIVFLSGSAEYRGMAAQVAEGYRLKVAAVLSKPFRVPALRQTLQAMHQQVCDEQRGHGIQGGVA